MDLNPTRERMRVCGFLRLCRPMYTEALERVTRLSHSSKRDFEARNTQGLGLH
jgi:hypothetical protein